MTDMFNVIFVLMIITSTSCEIVLEKEIPLQAASGYVVRHNSSPGCPLLPNMDLAVCEVRGHIKHGEAFSVGEGSTCVLTQDGKDNRIMCERGTWREAVDAVAITGARRRKRSELLHVISVGTLGDLNGQTDNEFTPVTWVHIVSEADIGNSGHLAFQVHTPYTPPSITCPSVASPITTNKGEVTTVVSWDPATATDEEDGMIGVTQTQGPPPGTRLANGEYSVTYMARDSLGLLTTCSFSFSVQVTRCPVAHTTYIQYGAVSCIPPDNKDIYGSECSYKCERGYELDGPSTVKCEADGAWSDELPSCKAISCGAPQAIVDGILICSSNDYTYHSICAISCKEGYKTDLDTITCLATKEWSLAKPCLDVTPPVIHCINITTLAGPQLSAVIVRWTPPEVKDNSGLRVTLTSDRESGSMFEVGKTVVTFTAVDLASNSAKCNMVVTVNVKHCSAIWKPPNADVTCSHGNAYGFVCNITCHKNYELEGDATRTCQSNQMWTRDDPRCVAICPSPPLVNHGRFECKNGHQYQASCSLTCDPGFKVTRSLSITCNVTAQWSEAGWCKEICPSLPPPRNGAMVCGAVSDGAGGGGGNVCAMLCHQSYQYPDLAPVVFMCSPDGDGDGDWTPDFVPDCDYPHGPGAATDSSELLYFNHTCDSTSIELKHKFMKIANASGFSKPSCNVTIQCNIDIAMAADIGYASDLENPCFDLCGPGEVSSTGVQPCDLCPRGTYQSRYGMTSCVPCPFGMSTPHEGAISNTECLSFDIQLDNGISRSDVQLASSDLETYTILTWLYMPLSQQLSGQFNNSQSGSMQSIRKRRSTTFSEQMGSVLVFSLNQSNASGNINEGLFLDLFGIKVFLIPSTLKNGQSIRPWHHVAIVCSAGNMTLYIDGQQAERSNDLPCEVIEQRSVAFSSPNASVYAMLSGLQMTNTVLSPAQVRDMSSTCGGRVSNNILVVVGPGDGSMTTQNTCDDIDNCVGQECSQHGTCVDGIASFTCQCENPWYGDRCQSRPNYCDPGYHLCANGALCVNQPDQANYTCLCTPGSKGWLCNEKIVNGGWGAWSEWSNCSTTCGKGQRLRSRECNNPRPDPEGMQCQGHENETLTCQGLMCPVNGGFGPWSVWSSCSATCNTGFMLRTRKCDSPPPSNGGVPCDSGPSVGTQLCNTEACPECPAPVLRSGHQSFECRDREDNSMQDCSVVCKPGLVLMPDGVNQFQCGRATNYTWSQQTLTNPLGLLPDCSGQKRPYLRQIMILYTFKHLDCGVVPQADKFNTSIVTNVKQEISCVRDGVCNFMVDANSSCESDRDNRQGTVKGFVLMQMKANTSVPPQYLSTLSDEERRTERKHASKVEVMIVELMNKSANLLKITVDGAPYSGSMEAAQIRLQCQKGSGYYNGFCVDCPPGSYSTRDGWCAYCDKGTYQDQAASYSCVTCPLCMSTLGKGSFSSEHCTVRVDNCTVSLSKASGAFPVIIIGAAVGAGGLIVLAVIIGIIVWRHRRNPSLKQNDGELYSHAPGYDGYDRIACSTSQVSSGNTSQTVLLSSNDSNQSTSQARSDQIHNVLANSYITPKHGNYLKVVERDGHEKFVDSGYISPNDSVFDNVIYAKDFPFERPSELLDQLLHTRTQLSPMERHMKPEHSAAAEVHVQGNPEHSGNYQANPRHDAEGQPQLIDTNASPRKKTSQVPPPLAPKPLKGGNNIDQHSGGSQEASNETNSDSHSNPRQRASRGSLSNPYNRPGSEIHASDSHSNPRQSSDKGPGLDVTDANTRIKIIQTSSSAAYKPQTFGNPLSLRPFYEPPPDYPME